MGLRTEVEVEWNFDPLLFAIMILMRAANFASAAVADSRTARSISRCGLKLAFALTVARLAFFVGCGRPRRGQDPGFGSGTAILARSLLPRGRLFIPGFFILSGILIPLGIFTPPEISIQRDIGFLQ